MAADFPIYNVFTMPEVITLGILKDRSFKSSSYSSKEVPAIKVSRFDNI